MRDLRKIESLINLAEAQLVLLPWNWFKQRREMKRMVKKYNKVLVEEWQKRIKSAEAEVGSGSNNTESCIHKSIGGGLNPVSWQLTCSSK